MKTGILATVLVLSALVLFRFLPGGDAVPAPIFFGAWVIAAVGGLVVMKLPWARLFASGIGMPTLYLWSVLDVVLITIVIIAAGDANPSFFALYFLTTLFFAPIYPLRMQVALFLLTAAGYLIAALITHPTLTVADHFLRVATLAVAGVMVSFISKELLERVTQEGEARADLATRFEDLQKADELFRAVSELATDYVYAMTVREDGTLAWDWVSGAYTRVLGYTVEESSQRGWQELIHPDDIEAANSSFGELLAGERSISEVRVRNKDGRYRCLRTYAHPVWDEDRTRVVRIFGAVQDITERKEQQQALERSLSLLRATLESTADGILVVDSSGKMVAFNQKFVDMWRIPQDVAESRDDERAIAVVMDQLIDPHAFLEKIRSLYGDETAESMDELHFKDGRVFERFSQPRVLDGHTEGRVWSFRDVTEQRAGEQKARDALEALREADAERRRLLAHLVRAKEDERSRVAADIHDDSVQVMTSVAIELERLERRVSDPDLATTLSRIEDRVRDAVKRLRSMVFELKPPSLVDEGLLPALTMYLEEFAAETGITYQLINRLDGEPPEDLRVALYRISQEALTNVRKHSQASEVDVILVQEDGEIGLRIADNGNGFTGSLGASPGHIGVMEMRERAEILGGTFQVRPGTSGGTVVEASIPFPARAAANGARGSSNGS